MNDDPPGPPVLQRTAPAGRRILVSDFDGTITDNDFYQLIARQYMPRDAPAYFEEFRQDRLTHFEAMRAYMSHAPEDADQLERLMEQTRPDPQFAETVHRLTRSGWEVVVASAGSSWYIERILARAGVAGLPIHANRGSIQHGRGLWMELPVDSPFFSPEVGIDKAAIVRDAISRAEVAAFAGDGPLDLGPAMLVKLEFRFARGWLARELARLGEPFTECRRWADIAVALSDAGHLE